MIGLKRGESTCDGANITSGVGGDGRTHSRFGRDQDPRGLPGRGGM